MMLMEAPNTITGILPIFSVRRPLSGLDNRAIKEKAAMFHPRYLIPPSDLNILGSSGITMLKLAKKNNVARHMSQKFLLKPL